MTVLIVDENGSLVEQTGDPQNHLHRILANVGADDFLLLKDVDWYGDTIFNRLQMTRFISEWRMLRNLAVAYGAEAIHTKIEGMASRCAQEVHVYLKFQGD